jgi:hypothetical protein
MIGKEWTEATLQEAMKFLSQITSLPNHVPGGQPEYRSALCVGFLYKFYLRYRWQGIAFVVFLFLMLLLLFVLFLRFASHRCQRAPIALWGSQPRPALCPGHAAL